MTTFRPWGHVDWVLGRLTERAWSFVGVVGTEARSTALARYLSRGKLHRAAMLAIKDASPLDEEALNAILAGRQADLVATAGYGADDFTTVPLMADLGIIRAVVEQIAANGATSLIVDITSMPKRWFFALVQAALDNPAIEDLLVTYTAGVGYADTLAENMSPLRTLPGFYAEDGRTDHDVVVVGIGFEPSGLPGFLQDQKCRSMRLIFPFPPGPPGHRRNWLFVRDIERLTQGELDDMGRVHIHMYDVPQVFDALGEMSDDARATMALAPYGPKTVSLAMCLFALSARRAGRPDVPVFYAQPLRYADDYTKGAAEIDGVPETTCYCVRLGGRDLYALP